MKGIQLNSKTLLALTSLLFSTSQVYAADTVPAAANSDAQVTVQHLSTTPSAANSTPSAPASPKEQVAALVLEAIKYVKEKGAETAFAEFNRPNSPFTKDNVYVFAIDFKGNILAHGHDFVLVGTNNYDIKDAKGRSVVRALIENGRYGEGTWVSYYWKNPATQVEECKSSFVTPVDNKFVIGAGFHHPLDDKGQCRVI